MYARRCCAWEASLILRGWRPSNSGTANFTDRHLLTRSDNSKADMLPAVDLRIPDASRIYNCFLGGSANFEADRSFARRAEEAFPGVADACQYNRDFLRRTILFAVESGIRQILDIGCGIPTAGSVHDVVSKTGQPCRVVYVDNKPQAVVHMQYSLKNESGIAAIQADFREPAAILDHRMTRELIDFDEPVMILMLAFLHFVPDRDQPERLVKIFQDAVVPGSQLAVSHATDGIRSREMRELEKVYTDRCTPAYARPTAWIDGLFGDWTPAQPGNCFVSQWRPDESVPDHPERFIFYGGVATKQPSPAHNDTSGY